MTAKPSAIGRAQTSSAAARPARTNRSRDGESGKSNSTTSVSMSAAGPCCQSDWLAVHHRFEPSAAAVAASHASCFNPNRKSTTSSASPAIVVTAAVERLVMMSNQGESVVSHPGCAQSR